MDYYQVDMESGAIIDQRGYVLYDAASIKNLSLPAKVRLAQLHSIHPDLAWEGSIAEGRQGAWDILLAEGLMESEVVAPHTPTPWTLSDDGTGIWSDHLPIGQNGIIGICSCGAVARSLQVNKANAAFIVRAVNAYADLVAVCEMIATAPFPLDDFDTPNRGKHTDTWIELQRTARAALAKAHGTD